MIFSMGIRDILIILPLLILSLTVHEYAHARVSTALGDPTPRSRGRLTLNPLAHLDPFGTLMLLIAGFGWARPVPIDMRYYKRHHLGLVLTSLAGPLSNLAITTAILLIFKIMFLLPLGSSAFLISFMEVLQQAAFLNVLLFVLNMLPIPPLDGSRLVSAALRNRRTWRFPTTDTADTHFWPWFFWIVHCPWMCCPWGAGPLLSSPDWRGSFSKLSQYCRAARPHH
jgi:Zn-dependent protease